MLISSKGRYALRLMIYIAALGDVEGKMPCARSPTVSTSRRSIWSSWSVRS